MQKLLFQAQQHCNLFDEFLIRLFPVKLNGHDDVFIHVQDRNKIIILENEADPLAAEYSQVLVFQLAQLIVIYLYRPGSGAV